MAVLTNAGGPGVTAADALEANGLSLAGLSPETISALQATLPPAASLNNPVDMLASATPEQYATCLDILLAAPQVFGVLVILPPPPMHTAGAVAKSLIPVIHATNKPVIIALMGERLIQEAVEHFRAAHIPEYRFPERAASALAILAERAEFLQRKWEAEPLVGCDQISPQPRLDILGECLSQRAQLTSGDLPQDVISRLLQAYGIPSPPIALATSVEEALRLAESYGFPVALKIASQDISHKSDAGGVILNLIDSEALVKGYNTILNNARQMRPEASLLGVYVQPMVLGGQDVILGAVQDPDFGPVVMFGSGGVEVEGLKDVSFALAPITREEAEYMLEKTWAGRKLRGYRNISPADREAVVNALLCLAQLAVDFPELSEIEINPLRVLGEQQGILALDIRARLAP
jgi:acetyltransferase